MTGVKQSRSGAVSARIGRRQALFTLAAALVVAGAGTTRAADEWPTRTVRIVVPFPPGGPADGSARVLADVMGPKLGQAMIVENRSGGGGVVGITAAAQANDGHTLLMGSTSMVITPSLQAKLSYDVMRDFDPIGMVSAQPLVVVVPASSPIRSIAELIKTAKEQPGSLGVASSGNGTLSHLTEELFSAKVGVSLMHVAYRGESALMPDLITGTVALGFLNLPAMLPQIREGKLRALAVTTHEPIPELPGVPTLRSLNIEGLEVDGWAALLATKGIPEAGLAKLEKVLNEALQSQSVKERFAAFGVAPVISGRSKLREYLVAETARWGEVIRSRGIKVE